MLDSFFLGFKGDEPNLFSYNGEPSIVFYSEKKGERNAILATLKMMCCQILTSMNPLCYVINVVDIRTGGAEFSPFQVTSENEETSKESPIFKIIGSTNTCSVILEDIYKEYNNRRIKVLGSSSSIEEYNSYKESIGAKTMPYRVVFFYEYDYNLIISNEKLRQLCKVANSVGIQIFFMINTDSFEPKDLKREERVTLSDEFKYKNEDIYSILKVFDDRNIYSFKFQNETVDITIISKESVINKINNNK